MTDAQVTIVVVPRERFSYTSRSLESIYEHTDIPNGSQDVSGICGQGAGRIRQKSAYEVFETADQD